ncbi:MAG: Hsp20/alpha crystallin family protein [Candidatus Marinimicrobia bacterium]|nr:Hsp20/alpha crystallin family protein [Candidatus Neomarinimicrobiota bacterium]MBL7059540.1 Hsp20/alpha crystallin family protein [Candidatus Neomarinimicrobiota bacterium]
MTLVKMNPRRTTLSPWTNWDRMVSDFYNTDEVEPKSSWTPAVDISEDDKAYQMHVDLPGLSRKDISVNIKDNVLTVSGERSYEKNDKKDTYYRVERGYGKFSRCFRLPDEVIEDNINASFKNGVLNVTVPKAEEVPAKELEIKVA